MAGTERMTLINMHHSVDILILESEPKAADIICELLPRDFSPRIVSSVQEAEAELDNRLPDLFLCADDLPEESGLMFLARTRGKWTTLRRILMAPDPDGELFFSALREVPLLSYISKPLEKREFHRILRHALWESDPDTHPVEARKDPAVSREHLHKSLGEMAPLQLSPMVPSTDVVIIEADPHAAARLTSLLPWGFRHHIASTVEEAETLLDANPPHLILCADDLPTESGLMFLARTKEKWPTTKRLLMVPNPDSEFFFYATQQVSFLSYLSKPVRKIELLHVLRHVLHDNFSEEENLSFPEEEPPPPEGSILKGVAGCFVLLLGAALVFLILEVIYQIKCKTGFDVFPNWHLFDFLRL